MPKPKLNFYYAAITFIISVRFAFIFKGVRSLIDESRYSFSLRALDSLQKKDITGFFYYLSSTSGRPASAIINLLPASLQGMLYVAIGLNPDTPTSYLIPNLFNCLVLVISMYLLYKIGLLVLHDKEVALVVVIVYSCLVNTNIYINHLLPYDMGILISLFIIFYILTIFQDNNYVSKMQGFVVGLLAMLLLAEYPGYYLMVPIAGFMLVDWNNLFVRFYENVLLALAYIGGILAGFAFFEGIARLGGVSYLERSSTLSDTITQGSFEEGFSFLFKYLCQVEGALGILLIVSILTSFALVLVYVINNSFSVLWKLIIDKPAYILVVCLICAFVFHASLSYFFHKIVFYGRLIHPYILYIVLFCVGNTLLKGRLYYKQSGIILSLIALSSFGLFGWEFLKLEYPRDILFEYGVNTSDKNVVYNDEYKVPIELYHYKSPMMLKRGESYTSYKGKIILLNYSIIDPRHDTIFTAYRPTTTSRLLHEGPHFAAYPAYMFEGLDIVERNFIDKHDFKVRLYNEN